MRLLEKNIEIMHDLLAIQHERIAVYQVFMKYPVNDAAVYKVFKLMADRSRHCLFELRSHITTICDPASRLEVKGEIYSSWPGMKYFGPDSSPADILSCCEHNEERTANAYQRALEMKEELCTELRDLLDGQLQLIQRSFEFIQLQKEKPLEPAATMEERIPFLFSRGYAYESIPA
ncbi:MAG TPA: hypothetical protein VMZ03_07885 [Chitinophagaceae bacterium]|nr:hypothetical protein [Chitinophagaceae bacterium]